MSAAKEESKDERVIRRKRPVEVHEIKLTEDEVDLIDSLRSRGQRGKPLEEILEKYGYELED